MQWHCCFASESQPVACLQLAGFDSVTALALRGLVSFVVAVTLESFHQGARLTLDVVQPPIPILLSIDFASGEVGGSTALGTMEGGSAALPGTQNHTDTAAAAGQIEDQIEGTTALSVALPDVHLTLVPSACCSWCSPPSPFHGLCPVIPPWHRFQQTTPSRLLCVSPVARWGSEFG